MGPAETSQAWKYQPLSIDVSPKTHRRQYRPKVPLSILAILIVVFGLQFIVLPQYIYQQTPSEKEFSNFIFDRLEDRLQRCAEYHTPPVEYPETRAGSRTNPRWNPTTGQSETIVLKNTTLFDGESFLNDAVDIVLKNGVIESVTATGKSSKFDIDAKVFDLDGKYVTPGLVDMHSHHMAMSWPLLRSTDDTNEVNDLTGPLTPQVNVLNSLKAYDIATEIIASGGVTTSLILPGSANIMGGEAVLVKNALQTGENREIVVEEALLEHGISKSERRRYMKMACGENPRRVYRHTRMGNAWIFRQHLAKAKDLRDKQDAFCYEAAVLKERGDATAISGLLQASEKEASAAELLEYDSTIAMLRGKIGINVHCYEPEDFENMLMHSKEFGFRIQAFHHALSAWQVPEMIKASGENITIATFAEMGFYKKEAYEANLWAGKMLAEHKVPLAYKSDHVETETNAKYLLFQAATGHSFHLPEDLALQSVTSVPAKSLEIDHRIGYVKPGYDADLVVWDSHPLSLGATPLQVYIDGKATLDPKKVEDSLKLSNLAGKSNSAKPTMRKVENAAAKEITCSAIERPGSKFTVTGITKSFLHSPLASSDAGNLSMVINNGKIICFDTEDLCAKQNDNGKIINLENGHVLPGLSAVSVSLGLSEIASEDSSGDGKVSKKTGLNPDDVVYAKYGIHLDGKGFARARIGGVTKAITAPFAEGFAGGVSVGIKTSGKKTILNGGVFQDDVALHFSIGQGSKGSDSVPTVSAGVSKLRHILTENFEKDNVYGRAANGSFPLVVHAENEYDIMQLIKIKQAYQQLKLIIFGGSGAPLVASELAAAKIPVILTANRGAQDAFQKLNSLPGPPLSRSPAAVLAGAGVKFGLSIPGEIDSHVHNIPLEAGWAAKYAGLSSQQAVNLVSRNIEEILELKTEEENRDFVIWEGDPLQFGATVVVGVDGEEVTMCWPEAT